MMKNKKIQEYLEKMNWNVWEDIITLRKSSEEKVLRSKLISKLKKHEMKETKDNVENKN